MSTRIGSFATAARPLALVLLTATALAELLGFAGAAENAAGTTMANGVPAASSGGVESARNDQRLREGIELTDQLGVFRGAGERTMFTVSGQKRTLVCLENLCLERVVQTMSEHPDTLQWIISGTVFEYRGNNYLMLRRATQKSNTQGTQPPRTTGK